MFELTEIKVKLGFLRNTKETSFSLFKTFISFFHLFPFKKSLMDACFFFLTKCWSTWLSMPLAQDWIVPHLSKNKQNLCKVLITLQQLILTREFYWFISNFTGIIIIIITDAIRLIITDSSGTLSAGEGCAATTSASTSAKVVASKSSSIRLGWTERRTSISSCNSQKGSSPYAVAVSWLSVDIPDFWKQFTIVCVNSASQAKTNICIPYSNEIFGRVFFFSTLWIIFQTTFLRYFAFNERVIPWSIVWVLEVVLGGRKYNLIAFRLSVWGWVVQLSITKTTFLPSKVNFLSSSLSYSSNNFPST